MNEVHKIYKQSMSSAGLKCLFTPTILASRGLPGKQVRLTWFLVISVVDLCSMRARLQVAVCSGYDLCHAG